MSSRWTIHINPLRIHKKPEGDGSVEKFGYNDVAAVVYTSGRSDAAQEFTGDPQPPLAAIDSSFGRRLCPAPLDRVERYCRTGRCSSRATTAFRTDATGPPQRDMTRSIRQI
jgi:hypothetical protein